MSHSTRRHDLEALAELSREELAELARKTLAIKSLAAFVRLLWPVLHGRKRLVWSWHMDAICDHLQALTEGRIPDNRLGIAVPPGSSKSLLCSVLWPAWEWLQGPEQSYLCVTNAAPLALRDAKRCRDVCGSPLYRGLQELAAAAEFGPMWEFARGVDAKGFFENSAHGFRLSQSTGARVTGHRAGTIIVDDPIDTADVFAGSRVLVESVAYFTETLSTRDDDETATRWLVVMQRQDGDDLLGWIEKHERELWTLLVLPAEFDPARRSTTCIGWSDPRQTAGELLSPRMSAAGLARRKRALGRRYRAQYDQQPASGEGKIFKLGWVKRFRFAELERLDWHVISIDCTLRDTRNSDHVSIQVWGGAGPRRYLLWSTRGRWGLVETKDRAQSVCALYPGAKAVLVERAHNGAAVIEALQRHVPAVIGVDQLGARSSKIARAESVSPAWEAGDCYIPEPAQRHPLTATECWFAADFEAELLDFPRSSRDDQVDAHCQALQWATKRKSAFSSALV